MWIRRGTFSEQDEVEYRPYNPHSYLALDEESQSLTGQEPLTVDRRFVGDIPQRRPGGLHHVVRVTQLELLLDELQNGLHRSHPAQQHLQISVDLAGEVVQQIYSRPLIEVAIALRCQVK